MKQYMVIERVKDGCWELVYERFERKGRLLPEGLHYVESWPSRESNICFQLMRTEQRGLLEQWVCRWSDLIEFDIFPLDEDISN